MMEELEFDPRNVQRFSHFDSLRTGCVASQASNSIYEYKLGLIPRLKRPGHTSYISAPSIRR